MSGFCDIWWFSAPYGAETEHHNFKSLQNYHFNSTKCFTKHFIPQDGWTQEKNVMCDME